MNDGYTPVRADVPSSRKVERFHYMRELPDTDSSFFYSQFLNYTHSPIDPSENYSRLSHPCSADIRLQQAVIPKPPRIIPSGVQRFNHGLKLRVRIIRKI